MANDINSKSFEVKPERPQDTSAAARASTHDGTSPRVTHGSANGTMGGDRDSDLRAHGESGSSGVGLPPMPDNDMRISSRDGAEAGGSESGGGSGAIGASTGTGPSQDIRND